jgi:hypothetical protein
MIIRVKEGHAIPTPNYMWEKEIDAVHTFEHYIVHEKNCHICGENVYSKDFLMWGACADKNIILCFECAKGMLKGLNRDILELCGHNEVKEMPSDIVGDIVFLKGENERLQNEIMKLIKRNIELQDTIARRDK